VIWWLKARLTHTVLTGGVAAFMALTCCVQGRTMVLPAFAQVGHNNVLLAFFTPLLLVGTLAHCLDSRLASAEVSGVRRVPWLDSTLILATMAAVLAFTGVGGSVLGSWAVFEAGRGVVFLTGLMLISRTFAGRAGIMVPLAWVFAVAFFGRVDGLHFHAWAVTAQPTHSVSAAVVTGIALVAGILLNQFVPRKSS
jgi:hypothetical protein